MLNKFLFTPLLLLFASCVSLSEFHIQVLEPATEPVTPSVKSIVLINRIILDQDQDKHPADTLFQESGLAETFNSATTEMLFSLAEILNESPGIDYLNESMLLEKNTTDPNKIPPPLEPEFIMYICDSLQADAIITLDGYYVESNDSIQLMPGELQTGWVDFFIGYKNLKINSLWRIYSKDLLSLIDEYLMQDSLSWEYAAFEWDEVIENLPTPTQALMEASYYTALTFARRISPYWIEYERFYYAKGNYNLRLGSYFLENNMLNDAEDIYIALLNRRNNHTASAAAHNLALIYELRGDFRQALAWARKSYQMKRRYATGDYIEILEERHTKSRFLDSQLRINP